MSETFPTPAPTEGGVEPAARPGTEGDLSRRFNLRGRSLRQHAARGTLINTAFLAGLSFLSFIRGFVLAGFLVATDYGVWGITVLTLNIVARLQQVGIGDKYIQQDEEDQEAAFQKAFSLSLAVAGLLMLASLMVLPLFAVFYGEWKIVLPGLLLSLNFLAGPFQMPIWFHYRRMEFVRQRLLQSIDPVATFIVSVALAIAGAGYWSLFIGALVGGVLTSIVAVTQSPYKLRWRYDKGTVREYWSFSGPLLLSGMAGLVIAQASMIATDAHLGLAAAGALTLASTISQFTDKVDGLVTGTMYPAICAVRDRMATLYESFVKSNRLALMWAMPFGIGLSLFCSDLVTFGIGEKWRPALPLLQAFGVIAALGHVGFNWHAYFRARGDTKPMAVAGVASAASFVVVGLPLLFLFDMTGLAIGVALQAVVNIAFRAYYLSRLFNGFAFLRHALRAVAPSIPATAVVLAMRLADGGGRTGTQALAELVLYLTITAVGTLLMEGRLLREALGYLRSRPAAA